MRAQASIATTTSGIIGRKIPTTSPWLDAAVLQRVGEALDVAQQVGVGDVALLALLAAPVERDAVAAARLDVAVEAVVRRVQLAAGEPLVERRVRVVERPCPTAATSRSASACSAHQASGSSRRLLVGRLVGDQARRRANVLGRSRTSIRSSSSSSSLLERRPRPIAHSSGVVLDVPARRVGRRRSASPVPRHRARSPTARRARRSERSASSSLARASCPASSRGTRAGSR